MSLPALTNGVILRRYQRSLADCALPDGGGGNRPLAKYRPHVQLLGARCPAPLLV